MGNSREKLLVEVCVGSLSDALAATAAGASRVELCSATEIGGLTPSAGLIEQVIDKINVPVVVMIRPRAGGFCYSREEFSTALRDAELAIDRGAAGIVFGFLSSKGAVDVGRCRAIIEVAGHRDTVFHRAFDFVPDALAAADQLVEMGVKRLLTSGQHATAIGGADLICTISHNTRGLLEVMPGGGISADNVVQLVRLTQCTQVHIGASQPTNDGSLDLNKSIHFYAPNLVEGSRFRAVQQSMVADVVKRIEHSTADAIGRTVGDT